MASAGEKLCHADPIDSVAETLEKLNLIVDGQITNAAIKLFGKNPQKYFTNAVVRVGKFKEDIMISYRRIEGNSLNKLKKLKKLLKTLLMYVMKLRKV